MLDRSDTAQFLLPAKAVRHVVSDATQRSWPIIEADVDGMPVAFPIETQAEPKNNKLFRCQLKPGYAFRWSGDAPHGLPVSQWSYRMDLASSSAQ